MKGNFQTKKCYWCRILRLLNFWKGIHFIHRMPNCSSKLIHSFHTKSGEFWKWVKRRLDGNWLMVWKLKDLWVKVSCCSIVHGLWEESLNIRVTKFHKFGVAIFSLKICPKKASLISWMVWKGLIFWLIQLYWPINTEIHFLLLLSPSKTMIRKSNEVWNKNGIDKTLMENI